MEPWWDKDVVLHEGCYWDAALCTSIAGSGGVGCSVGVDGTKGVGSGGGVDSGSGDRDCAGSIGGSRLCWSGFWVE